jgi:ribosomal protein S18 acetylase RimI-like enzyme
MRKTSSGIIRIGEHNIGTLKGTDRLDDVELRPATQADSEKVADVYLASRNTFLDFAPMAHSEAEVREWIANHLLPSGGVMVAVAGRDMDAVVGMMALSREDGVGWIDQLYLLPSAVGLGIGSRLVEQAKSELGPPIRLYTFQENAGARRFYERHGFRAIAFGNGSKNEEGCPDVLYEWAQAS